MRHPEEIRAIVNTFTAEDMFNLAMNNEPIEGLDEDEQELATLLMKRAIMKEANELKKKYRSLK